ncbi:MAG: response regulator [Calditrichaeota bacterium]|nr:response regulator [Calditrichota bacterium]
MEQTRRILVMDDEHYIRRLLSYIFEREGFEVYLADDGSKGISLAKQIKPDLIFTDVMMPVINGFQVCKELRSDPTFQNVFIIILTGRGQIQDAKKGLECGADEYIIKPFDPVKVIRRVKQLLKSPRTQNSVSYMEKI